MSPLDGALAALGGGDPGRAWWYLSRAAGLSAYVLLSFNVALGLAVRTRRLEPWITRWRVFDLHQFTALLLVAVAALHVLALLGDRYIGFTLPQLLVPLAAPYRPQWTALGVLALYLLLAIVGSFYARRVIGYRAWRRLHYLTFAVFALGLLHALLAGTDAQAPWAIALYAATGAAITALTFRRFRRLLVPEPEPAPATPAAPELSPPPGRQPPAPSPSPAPATSEPLWISR